jgi:hypothetical protein
MTAPETDLAARLTGAHRRTFDAIFRHPAAHNLEWTDTLALIDTLGRSTERANNEYVFEVAGERYLMHKPHTKDLTADKVIDLRHFLMRAGSRPRTAVRPDAAAPDLLIVVDHHDARIFHVDVASGNPSVHAIRPYDPHHFLHHAAHKDQSRERGQRAPEEPAYYERIADAAALGGRIVLIGHGSGKSNAELHLAEYLRAHHPDAYKRVVTERIADLSAVTEPQLLDIARAALRPR